MNWAKVRAGSYTATGRDGRVYNVDRYKPGLGAPAYWSMYVGPRAGIVIGAGLAFGTATEAKERADLQERERVDLFDAIDQNEAATRDARNAEDRTAAHLPAKRPRPPRLQQGFDNPAGASLQTLYRVRRARRLARVWRKAGGTCCKALAATQEQRQQAAAAAGISEPSDETWSIMVELLQPEDDD